MSKEMTYLFGRLNLIAHYDDKKDYLLKSLRNGRQIQLGDFDWGFFDISETSKDNQDYIVGHLVKYKPILTEQFVDKKTLRTRTDTLIDCIVAKSEFILHIKSGLIAYHPSTNNITYEQFQKHFARLIEAANDYLLISADIQPINEHDQILDAIKQFDSINRLVIYLHPSNPRFSDRWEKVDKKLKDLSADSYRAIYSSQYKLDLEGNEDAMSEIYMAVDGYGKATIQGTRKGRKASASTYKTPMKQAIPMTDNPISAMDHLIHKFREVWDRMTKQ